MSMRNKIGDHKSALNGRHYDSLCIFLQSIHRYLPYKITKLLTLRVPF